MGRTTSLRLVEPSEFLGDTEPGEISVHGVVLAAGTSSRYGDRNKLLEPFEGKPVVSHAVDTLVESSVSAVTVVVGYEAQRVTEAVDDSTINVRENEAFADGQSTSVVTGVEAARERDADAVVFALGDMPAVSAETVDSLIAAYASGVGDAVAAAYEGKRGNPVLFDQKYFDTLLDVDGDVGGRDILRENTDAVAVATDDPGVVYDIDRPADR